MRAQAALAAVVLVFAAAALSASVRLREAMTARRPSGFDVAANQERAARAAAAGTVRLALDTVAKRRPPRAVSDPPPASNTWPAGPPPGAELPAPEYYRFYRREPSTARNTDIYSAALVSSGSAA